MKNESSDSSNDRADKQTDESKIVVLRKEKLKRLREDGYAFPNQVKRTHLAGPLLKKYDSLDSDKLKEEPITVNVAGRMVLCRMMGKASFLRLQDKTGHIQLYIRLADVGQARYEEFKTAWDLGDILSATGDLFKTKTGELSIYVKKMTLLTKALRPLPEKFHGLSDTQTRYRQRYLDLIVNEKSRKTFLLRSKIITQIRAYFNDHDFLEVETPMMHVIPGGAIARPFMTHHNALNMPLFLRIAPELYLKRLVIGGFEKVYECNRSFRNEGISTQHNPEFTMIEFYQAYATYEDLMDFTERLFSHVAQTVLGTTVFEYQGNTFDFSKSFKRMTVIDSILDADPTLSKAVLMDQKKATALADNLGIEIKPSYGLGKIQIEIFEKIVEPRLITPTFITAYPAEVSPLARLNDNDPFVTDRFELFIAGKEIANGFSELNDPIDQAERFLKQVKEKDHGDDEAMHFDEDYIRALEHGLPPTAGEGIGIDRLVMLLTDSPSIRDVLLFPHMRINRPKKDLAHD